MPCHVVACHRSINLERGGTWGGNYDLGHKSEEGWWPARLLGLLHRRELPVSSSVVTQYWHFVETSETSWACAQGVHWLVGCSEYKKALIQSNLGQRFLIAGFSLADSMWTEQTSDGSDSNLLNKKTYPPIWMKMAWNRYIYLGPVHTLILVWAIHEKWSQ